MDKLMKKFFRSSLVSSITLFVLGILIIFKSEVTIIAISYLVGGVLIALGAFAIIQFIKNIEISGKNDLDILYGVVTIILGLLIVKNPKLIASVLPIIIGVAIIINSSTKLQYAFELKKENNQQWKTTMIISIISVICGVILLFNPFKGAVIITQTIGIFIIIYAVLDIVSTYIIKKNAKYIHDAISAENKEATIIEEKEIKTSENKNKSNQRKNKNKKDRKEK
mgnify:CR=1 FL=1